MRIRKHAQISPLVYADSSSLKQGGVIETYVCKLNQSPWDTISFPSSDYPEDPTAPPQPPPPPLHLYQVDGEDSSMANGSFSDCAEAENSELSMKFALDEGKEKWEEEVVDKNGNNLEIEEINQMLGGSKSSCRKKVVKERLSNYPATHHRSSSSHLKRHNNKLTKRSVSRRIRPKKPVSTSNPNEFYYYSGFGPRWGRRRGPTATTTKVVETPESYSSESLNIGPTAVKVEGGESSYSSESLMKNNNVDDDDAPEHMEESPSRICNDGFDYIEDDDDDDDDDDEEDYEDENGDFLRKKRARRPIKARSLKSLM